MTWPAWATACMHTVNSCVVTWPDLFTGCFERWGTVFIIKTIRASDNPFAYSQKHYIGA